MAPDGQIDGRRVQIDERTDRHGQNNIPPPSAGDNHVIRKSVIGLFYHAHLFSGGGGGLALTTIL